MLFSFVFNFLRVGRLIRKNIISHNTAAAMGCTCLDDDIHIVIFAKRLGPKVASFITTISIFALIPILLGFSYTHYYTTLIPLIPIYCAVFFYITSNKINILAVILCVINGISVGKLLCSIRVKYSALLKEVVFAKSPCQNKRRIFGYLLQCKTA